MSSTPTEDWALQEPAPSEVNISLSNKVSPEPPLNALDGIISAEIPDERQHPALRAVVLQTNMHHQITTIAPSPAATRAVVASTAFLIGKEQSFMSDLLWHFRQQREPVINNLTYTDFYAQYYFTTQDRDRPFGPNQWIIRNMQTRRGLRRKVLIRRQQGAKVVTRIHLIPPRIGELF